MAWEEEREGGGFCTCYMCIWECGWVIRNSEREYKDTVNNQWLLHKKQQDSISICPTHDKRERERGRETEER